MRVVRLKHHWITFALTVVPLLAWVLWPSPPAHSPGEAEERKKDSPAVANRDISRRKSASAQVAAGRDISSQKKYEAASTFLPPIPPGSKIVSVESEIKGGLNETVVKLESAMLPAELQIFYTDELVKEWMIYRDTLSSDVGWNGVFLQMGDIERRLGIFTVVKSTSTARSAEISTGISVFLAEQI